MDDFGLWVKRHRRRLGLSQEGLASRIGVDRSYVTRLESGSIRIPHPDTRARLHGVFGTDEAQLWNEVDADAQPTGAAFSVGRRLDRVMRDLDEGDHLMVERLVEDVIRVARAMATKTGVP